MENHLGYQSNNLLKSFCLSWNHLKENVKFSMKYVHLYEFKVCRYLPAMATITKGFSFFLKVSIAFGFATNWLLGNFVINSTGCFILQSYPDNANKKQVKDDSFFYFMNLAQTNLRLKLKRGGEFCRGIAINEKIQNSRFYKIVKICKSRKTNLELIWKWFAIENGLSLSTYPIR